MGKYTFTWEHAAQDVYVTGTFDDWRKTVKLDKEADGVFKKTVELPKAKTQYKFVVNGNWCTNDSAPKEDDGHGLVNNVLQPEDIVDEPAHAFLSNVPESSTAALAGAVPKESEKLAQSEAPKEVEQPHVSEKTEIPDRTKSQESVPGAFPMTPAAETPRTEAQSFNVSPLPATASLGNPIKLAPGEPVPDASTFTDNTVHSTVKHDKQPEEEQEETISVAPFPATAGLGNPIHLAPGEKVPDASTLTPHTVQSTVNTDLASYEKSDSLPPKLDLGLTPTAEREANGGMFGLPPVTSSLIPESSLPMGVDAVVEKDTGVAIQSAAPLSSTAILAGQVPKEPKAVSETTVPETTVPETTVPETVAESQKEAGFAPEASANSEAVLEKKEVEQELLDKVPEAPVTADDTTATINNVTSNIGTAATTVAGVATAGVIAGAGLFTAAIYSAKEQAAHAVGLDKSAPAGDVAVTAKDKAIDAVGLDSSATASQNAFTAKDKALESAIAAKDQTVAAANVAKDQTVAAANVAKDQTIAAANVATGNAFLAKDKAIEAVGLDKSASVAGNADLAKGKAFDAVGLDKSASAAGNADIAKGKAFEAVGLDKSASATGNAFLAKDKVAQSFGLNGSTTAKTADAVPAIVSESQKEAHVSPEAATNPEAVAEKSQLEQELLSQVHKTTDHGESAPAIAVPAIVSESQREAHVAPEAAANVEAVAEKKALESQLLSEIPKATEAGEPAPVITAATTGVAPGSQSVDVTHSTPAVSSSVPEVVAESQKEAHVSPEAAANTEAVTEKTAVEKELLKEVEKVNSSGEPAPTASTSATPVAPLAFQPYSPESTTAPASSTSAAPVSTPAAPVPTSVEPASSSKEANALNAPASAPAQPAMQRIEPTTSVDFNKKATNEQTQPIVTTGVESSTIPKATNTSLDAPTEDTRKYSDVSPRGGTPASQSIASGADDKKKKRRSFFGKIKDKLSSKN